MGAANLLEVVTKYEELMTDDVATQAINLLQSGTSKTVPLSNALPSVEFQFNFISSLGSLLHFYSQDSNSRRLQSQEEVDYIW